MNPEIEKQIVSLIEAAKQTCSDTVSFITQQAPDVIAQLIRWKICEGVFFAVFGAALLGAAFKLFRVTYKSHKAGDADDVVWVPAGMAIVAMSIGGVVAACNGVTQAVKATIAPKVLILEMVTDAVRPDNK